MVEAAATVAPRGKQATFGSRARASYMLCERGAQQPRSLAVAFLESVESGAPLTAAINQLGSARDNMDKVYGACADKRCEMNAHTGEGKLEDIIRCVTE